MLHKCSNQAVDMSAISVTRHIESTYFNKLNYILKTNKKNGICHFISRNVNSVILPSNIKKVEYTHFRSSKPVTVLISLLLFSTTSAATYYSRGSGDRDTNATWSFSPGGVTHGAGICPVAGDSTIIRKGFNATVPIDFMYAGLLPGTINSPGSILPGQKLLNAVKTASSASDTPDTPGFCLATKDTDRQRVQTTNTTNHIYTRIEICGTRYSDKMWIITDSSCTKGFDNGWDGSKFFGSSLTPQLWAMEDSGDYQVDAVDDINNTYLGFIKGEDSIYKMTFIHENQTSYYTNLYLIDLLTDTTTYISVSGTTYTFSADQAAHPDKRFKIITKPGLPTNDPLIRKTSLKIFSSGKTIFVQNQEDMPGGLILYTCSGLMILKAPVNAHTRTTIPTYLPAGVYLVKVRIKDTELTERILIR